MSVDQTTVTCPAWCTFDHATDDDFGDEEYIPTHTTAARSVEILPTYPYGPGGVDVQVDLFDSDGYTTGITVYGWQEGSAVDEVTLTADQAEAVARALVAAAVRLREIETDR